MHKTLVTVQNVLQPSFVSPFDIRELFKFKMADRRHIENRFRLYLDALLDD